MENWNFYLNLLLLGIIIGGVVGIALTGSRRHRPYGYDDEHYFHPRTIAVEPMRRRSGLDTAIIAIAGLLFLLILLMSAF